MSVTTETQLSNANSLENLSLVPECLENAITDVVVIDQSVSAAAMSTCSKLSECASATFHLQTKKEEASLITPTFIKEALKTGVVKLNGRGIHSVPDKIWHIETTEVANIEDQYHFDRKKDFPWWQRKPIQNVDLSSNAIVQIPPTIQELINLVSLNLHDNSLTTLPDEIGLLRNLTKLDLCRNKITTLPNGFFKLTELTNLNLSRNQLTIITSKFTELIMLEYLDLSENNISKLPRGLGFLIRLIELNLSHNKLTSLPLDIVNLRDLKKFDISHNGIKSLPALNELRKLEFLYAFNNKITEIPDMNGCLNLKECFLGQNNLKYVPAEFCQAVINLKTLDLPNNKIEALPDEISNLQQLCRLNVQNNSLTYLPNTLCLLPHLQTLTVDGNAFRTLRRDVILCGTSRILKFLRERYENELSEMKLLSETSRKQNIQNNTSGNEDIFPDRYTMRQTKSLMMANRELNHIPDYVFENMAKVEANILDLCKNNFTEVPSGIKLIANYLTELNMSMNKLTSVPELLGDCLHLKYLNLSKNHIETLPDSLSNLKKIQELNLSNNRFTSISSCIYNMYGLEILNLRDNKVEKIDAESLQQLKRLAILDLMNNNIGHIPPTLGKLKQLHTLELCGNCFRHPSHAILQKGTESVLSYLRDKIPDQ